MPLKGVNLGGWLVLEKWMTPSVFSGSDARNEYELAHTAKGRKTIARHHATFITEADFQWLSKNGITAVRIPVGHWIFGDEAPYIEAIDKLDWAMTMAEKYSLQVLIDLHGAPGAQNAADHSGSGGPGLPGWLDDPVKLERTIVVLERLVKRYNASTAFWGIEIVNEPLADRWGWKLTRFYRQAYWRLAKIARPGLYIVFSDGFKPLLLAGALWRWGRLPVAIDCHLYHCFGERNKQRSLKGHLQMARRWRWLIRFLSIWHPVIVGEWSSVLPRPMQDPLSQKERVAARNQFIGAQRGSYDKALGWFYWNYKTENDSGWNLRSLVESGAKVVQ